MDGDELMTARKCTLAFRILRRDVRAAREPTGRNSVDGFDGMKHPYS